MKSRNRSILALIIATCMLAVPMSVFGSKGKDHFDRGIKYEKNEQWEQAAQEFTLALAADPSNVDYRLHYQRAVFNASQMFMQRGRALAEQTDYIGAYNAFRQALGYDPVNQLAVSEMERMLRLQEVKEGKRSSATPAGDGAGGENGTGGTPAAPSTARPQEQVSPAKPEAVRNINFNSDLKAFIRTMADDLNLNVIFDRQSFATPRTIEVHLKDVTSAKALDYVFLQEGLFFQKLDRRTILVADQSRRAQYQQLVVKTFYISNADPDKVKGLIAQVLPASVGRPQSIVYSDKDTNSLTVRDTAENVQLIGELIKSIDKDRAEVVMDVNIYEVSRSDLMQLGNQVGSGTFNIGGSPGFALLTDNAVIQRRTAEAATRGVNVAGIVGGVPTALAAALVIPPSVLTAFQSKNNAKLLASTQVHAFNNEESQARIGQRVPVQTASINYYNPSPTSSPGGANQGIFNNGYPVINYEPTGLTLNFTPIVFPNLDVQVKMKINSKDVAGANSLTPTFTEREITGTARVQNNRTMLLASVTQDIQSNGRQGLPILGGLPLLGRLFTSPTKENRQVDIVISVTPRVLRAPALTPRDEEMRQSGTLQSPTTGSIATMLAETEREEQIAAARRIPKQVNIQLPDAPLTYEPQANVAAAANQSNASLTNSSQSAAVVTPVSQDKTLVSARTQDTVMAKPAAEVKPEVTSVSSPAEVQPKLAASTQTESTAPKPMDVAAAIKSVVSPSTVVSQTASSPKTDVAVTPAVEELAPKSEKTDMVSKPTEPAASVIELSLAPEKTEMQLGEKRQVAIHVHSDTALAVALIALRFDPHVIKIGSVSAGSIFANATTAPTLTQSIDEHGILLVSLTPAAGSPVSGEGALLNIDFEAAGVGDAALNFDIANINVMAKDGRPTALQINQGRLTVKPADNPTVKPVPPAPRTNPEETGKTSTIPPALSSNPEQASKSAAPVESKTEISAAVIGEAVSGATETKAAAVDTAQATTAKPNAYVVLKRDNLWKIAKANGTTVESLRQANPKLRSGILSIGSELVIP